MTIDKEWVAFNRQLEDEERVEDLTSSLIMGRLSAVLQLLYEVSNKESITKEQLLDTLATAVMRELKTNQVDKFTINLLDKYFENFEYGDI